MRQQVIDTIGFPRYKLLSDLDFDSCLHAGFYHAEDQKCQECDFRQECHWLMENDHDTLLKTKPMKELLEALEFAITYVDVQVDQWGHNSHLCRCEVCAWLKDAKRLARIF